MIRLADTGELLGVWGLPQIGLRSSMLLVIHKQNYSIYQLSEAQRAVYCKTLLGNVCGRGMFVILQL